MKNKIVRAMLVAALTVSMVGTSMSTVSLAASKDPVASAEREKTNAEVSQYAATQGMVLLENHDNVLPIAQKQGTKIALFGEGAYHTIKGGTGSGDVYLKDGVDIDVQQGFEDAGYDVVTKDFLAAREAEYQSSGTTGTSAWGSTKYDEPAYKDADVTAAAGKTDTAVYVLTRNSGEGSDRKAAKGDYYLTDNEKANLTLLGQKFDKVIVVLNSGGVIDTNFFNGDGNYGADDELNRGKIEGLDSLLLMSQAGMNGGHAVVQVLNGEINPSGKLTDTWAVNYEDYPSSVGFSANDSEFETGEDGKQVTKFDGTQEEYYTDDVYVGYRYFDTFGKQVAYPFGYGLSYTDFNIDVDSVTADEKEVTVTATVTNTGDVAGKEVVEVYFSAPAGDLDKPYQELAGFQKVEVDAGRAKTVTVTFATDDMASYDEAKEAYVMEDGTYTIRVGNSSRNTVEAAELTLDVDVVTEEAKNELGLTKASMKAGNYDAKHVKADKAVVLEMLDKNSTDYGKGITPATEGLTAEKATGTLKAAKFDKETHTYENGVVTTYVSSDASTDSGKYAADKTASAEEKLVDVAGAKGATLKDVVNGKATVEQLVADMSDVELADLVEGGTYGGLEAGTSDSAVIGSQAASVFGAAGETTSNLYNSRYIPNIVMSDGPAGIRVTKEYIQYDLVGADAAYVPGETYYTASYSWSGAKYTEAEIADEAAYKEEITKGTKLFTTTNETYYQYCTAFPIGTLIAQSWDPEVAELVGRGVGTEMLELGVTSWLAPGMNIHRNPLCGRNFEYFSEDPLISGKTAAGETKGVQTKEDGSYSGIGVNLKHFAFNNQEASRMGSNSVVSERAAREIYLKGFEIAVKEAAPDYIMSSYNAVNGESTFESYGLLTEILRSEWGFKGFVMTDWYSIMGVKAGLQHVGENVQMHLMRAGNDCEMPGGNVDNILKALADGSLKLGSLQKSAINMLNVIKRSAIYEDLDAKLATADIENLKAELEQAKKDLAEANQKVEAVTAQAGASDEAIKAAQKAADEAKAAVEALKAEIAAAKTPAATPAETKLDKVALKKVKAAKKSAKATWSKVTGAEGYEVTYATAKNFKKASTKTTTKTSLKLTKLKSKKKCFVKVRAYKTVDGKKVYGAYSAVKSAKIK